MAVFKILIKTDNSGLDQELVINNIYIEHGLNGALEVHAFAGPDAQTSYERFVRNRKRYIASRRKKYEATGDP